MVGEAADIMADTTGEKLGGVMNELQNGLVQIFLAGEPFINTLLPMISDLLGLLLPPLTSIMEKLMPVIQAQLEALMPLVEAALKILLPILDAVIGMIAPVLELVFTALTPLLEIIGTLLEHAFKPFQAVIGRLRELIGTHLGKAVEFIKGSFERVKDIFSGIIDFIKNVFTGNWKGVWDSIVSIFSNIIEGIGAVFKKPINWIISGLNVFIRAINKIKIPDWVPVAGGKGFQIPEITPLKVGMDFVPVDDFPALLHRGEAVLPAAEAEVYRGLGGIEGLERNLSYAAASADVNPVIVVEAGDTYLDGEKISQRVTTLQYADAAVRRYRG